jgi:hypothetical protein
VFFHAPAELSKQRVPGRRERHEVGHGGAGGEAHAGFRRQAEQFDEPRPHHFFGSRRGRRESVGEGVLIPSHRQPLRRHRRGKRSAHHKSEVARPGRGYQAGVRGRAEMVDHLQRIFRFPRQRAAHPGQQRRKFDGPADGPRTQAIQEVRRGGARSFE